MIKRFLAVLVAVSLFSLSVFAEEPFSPIYVMGYMNFRDGDNLILSSDSARSAYFEAGLGDPISYGSFVYTQSQDSFYNNFSATNVSGGYIRLTPLNGAYYLKQDQYYVLRLDFYSLYTIDSIGIFDNDWSYPFTLISSTPTSIVFCPNEDVNLNSAYITFALDKVYPTLDYALSVSAFSIQTLTGFTRADDAQDVIDAIENQTDSMEDQWAKEDQAMAGGVNPSQSGVNDSISQGIIDLDDFDNQIFADFDKYKADLDFGLSAWGEAAAGISYIGNIFMIIWNNSPNQVIVLSLMLGLCGLVLGRGARLARAARRSDRGADDG